MEVWNGREWVEVRVCGEDADMEEDCANPEDIEYFDCDGDFVIFTDLEGNCIEAIFGGFIEELHTYGDEVTLIAPFEDWIVRLKAFKLDNTVEWYIGEDDVVLEAFDYFLENGLIKEVLDVLKTNRWVGLGGYYGYSDYRSTGTWIKVVEGWVGGASKTGALLKTLLDIYKLRVEVDFPVLFISARSSSIFASYVYVFVRNEDLEKFKKLIPSPSYEDLHSPDYYLNLLV